MQIVKAALLCGAIMLTGCSSWVYRIDIPQGNYVEQQRVDKLRVAMTREQVQYILGSPVADSLFSDDKWYYVYTLAKNKSKDHRSELVIYFKDDKVTDITGSFKKPDDFDTPLEQ
jgi:outer membrane protein assembly factor BamE